MKKFYILALLFFLILSLESSIAQEKTGLEGYCGTMNFYNESIYYAENFPLGENDIKISKIAIQESIGDIKNFWVKDYYYGNNSWRQIPAVLVNVTNISYIYVELNEPNNASVWYNGTNSGYITQEDINSIAVEFESIYPTDKLYFGDERPLGVDNDPHVTILLFDIDGSYADNWSGSGYFGGYYYSLNEYSNTTNNCSNCNYSNQRKILFIDTYPQIENGNRTSRVPDRNHSNSNYQEGLNKSFSTIAHEFQHMIHWYHDPNEDSWINEGISDYAEFINGYGNPESHVQAFSKNPGDSLTTWDGALADYGAAYLFILYLSENYGGNSTIKNLVNNTKNGIDGINDTLKITGYNDTFQLIFPGWAIANILSNYSDANISMNYTKISSYPANSTGNIEQWASSYINFSNGNESKLNISFSGFGNSSFNISLIKGQNNSKTIEGISLIGNIGSGIINGLGSLYSYVIMVITSSTGGNYSYLAEYSSVVTTTTSTTSTTTTTSTITTTSISISTTSTTMTSTTSTTLTTTTTSTTTTTMPIPRLYLNPESQTVSIGSRFNVSITVDNITDLYANQFTLKFNPDTLTALNLSGGNLLGKDNGSTIIIINRINNTAGKAEYAETRVGAGNGISDSGILAVMEFNATANGISTLGLEGVLLSNSSANGIAVNIVNGSVSVGVVTTTTTITTTTTSTTSSTTTTIPLSCSLKGDKDCNGLVDDFELLDYINQWAKGIVGDFDLLEAINNWAKG